MSALFDSPFLIDRIGGRGGGVDFLGLRQVNLNILQDKLIPGLNNATEDMGSFLLGTWIPWKFRQICGNDKRQFVYSKFNVFREAIEMAMTCAMFEGSPSEQKMGPTRRRMGVRSSVRLPGPLSFAATNRTYNSSLYAAPLYGPSLRYLRLLQYYDARAEDGTSTDIPLASTDAPTTQLMAFVDKCLRDSRHLKDFLQLRVPRVKQAAVDDLGLKGLNPAFYRQAPRAIKQAFAAKFFSADEYGHRRWLTAVLICETIGEQTAIAKVAKHLDKVGFTRQDQDPFFEALLRIWYTGMLSAGRRIKLSYELESHRLRWAAFQARQIQRSILEEFLCCFETALLQGCRTIDSVIQYWLHESPAGSKAMFGRPLKDLCRKEASKIYHGTDFSKASELWNERIHPSHEAFDDFDGDDDSFGLMSAAIIMVRWWIRVHSWNRINFLTPLLGSGDRDRISISVFCNWLHERLDAPLFEVLHQLLSDLIFAQHIKFAIMRFDGEVQRLRFTLGDDGIVPTEELRDKLAVPPVRMADRLRSFAGILSDLDILDIHDGTITLGRQRLPQWPLD